MKTPMDKNSITSLIPRLIEELQAIQKAGLEDDTVLRALYEGNLCPDEENFYYVPGYREIVHEMAESSMEMRRLTENCPNIRKAYETYCETRRQMDAIERYELYAHGFGMAVRLIVGGVWKTP